MEGLNSAFRSILFYGEAEAKQAQMDEIRTTFESLEGQVMNYAQNGFIHRPLR